MALVDPPIYDEAIMATIDGERHRVVTHRNPGGEMVAFHSPLERVTLACTICAGGARVYLRPDDQQWR